jgi:hypothetical protein
VFPAPIMTTIAELGAFLAREAAASAAGVPPNHGEAIPVADSKRATDAS